MTEYQTIKLSGGAPVSKLKNQIALSQSMLDGWLSEIENKVNENDVDRDYLKTLLDFFENEVLKITSSYGRMDKIYEIELKILIEMQDHPSNIPQHLKRKFLMNFMF